MTTQSKKHPYEFFQTHHKVSFQHVFFFLFSQHKTKLFKSYRYFSLLTIHHLDVFCRTLLARWCSFIRIFSRFPNHLGSILSVNEQQGALDCTQSNAKMEKGNFFSSNFHLILVQIARLSDDKNLCTTEQNIPSKAGYEWKDQFVEIYILLVGTLSSQSDYTNFNQTTVQCVSKVT